MIIHLIGVLVFVVIKVEVGDIEWLWSDAENAGIVTAALQCGQDVS